MKWKYQIRLSGDGYWHVYDENGNWVGLAVTKLGAKFSARWDAFWRRNPTKPYKCSSFEYEV